VEQGIKKVSFLSPLEQARIDAIVERKLKFMHSVDRALRSLQKKKKSHIEPIKTPYKLIGSHKG